jgi:hypothetical protein
MSNIGLSSMEVFKVPTFAAMRQVAASRDRTLATDRTKPRRGRSRFAATAERNGNRFLPTAKSWKGRRMSKLAFALAFLCMDLSLALAQSKHAGTSQEQQACTRDASRYCRQQLGDDASVQRCLQQNRQKLSSACQKVFQSHGQ